MAKILRILGSGVGIDMVGGTDYFTLADEGWNIETSLEPVWETFSLIANTTDATIRSQQKQLDRAFEIARRYAADPKETAPVYLEILSEGDSDVKRAAILDGRTKYGSGSNISPLLGAAQVGGNNIALITVAVLRTPYFEPTTATSGTFTSISTNGGTVKPFTATDEIPARIDNMRIYKGSAGGSDGFLSKFWIGIRRERRGTTGFIATWEAEAGTNLIADTTNQTDGTASNNMKKQITFATSAALAARFWIEWGSIQMTANWNHLVGDYLVLARVKLSSAATEVRILTKQGYRNSHLNGEIIGDIYLSAIENANLVNWNLVELGLITVPPQAGQGRVADGEVDNEVKYFQLSLFAERLSASGSLDVDEFILIPIDGLAVISGASVKYLTGGDIFIYTSPLDEVHASAYDLVGGGGARLNAASSFGNWGYVPDGIIVIAAQEDTLHRLGQLVDLFLATYPRSPIFFG